MTDRNQRLSNDTATLRTPASSPTPQCCCSTSRRSASAWPNTPRDPPDCTVFYFPDGVTGAVDIRGGAPGVLQHPWNYYDAICFAGGSLYGIEAASGVAAELLATTAIKLSTFITIASSRLPRSATNSRARTPSIPTKRWGEPRSGRSAVGSFPLALHAGAGASATVGKGVRFAYRKPAESRAAPSP